MSVTGTVGSFARTLRRRKIPGVAVAYAVVGFGLIEASGIILPRLQLPQESIGILIAVVFFAFPVALLATWLISGDDETDQVGRMLPLVSLILVASVSGWLGLRVLQPGEAPSTASKAAPPSLPLVIMMDSPHPARVYDEETLAANGTNADVISDILLDLPIRRQRESIGPDWHRDEEILQFDPDLIVIHYSGFRQEDGSGPRERLKLFISFFTESDTRFLIYSRAEEATLRRRMDRLLADLEEEHPGLLSRIDVFGLDDHGPRSWRSPLTANPLKLRVKETLRIQP